MKDKDLFYRMAVPVCLLVAVPYYVLHIRNRIGMFGLGESCYYHVTTPDVLICLVTAIGMYGIYYFIGKHLPQKAVAAAYRIGADMTAFYYIHWLFVALSSIWECISSVGHRFFRCRGFWFLRYW